MTTLLLQVSSHTQLNTHTCYKFLDQVLDGCIKQKKKKKKREKEAGGYLKKRQRQVQKHRLEEIYNENSVRGRRRSETGGDTREKEKKKTSI